MSVRMRIFAVALFCGVMCANGQAISQITALPIGLAEALEEGDQSSQVLVITNEGNNPVEFKIGFDEVERDNATRSLRRVGNRQGGPRRDEIVGNFAIFEDTPTWRWINEVVFNRLQNDNRNMRFQLFNQAQHLENVDLDEFDALWIVGTDQSDAFVAAWNQNRARFEDYIDGGRAVFIELGWNQRRISPLPGGVQENRVPQEGILVVNPDDNWMIQQCARVDNRFQRNARFNCGNTTHVVWPEERIRNAENSDWYQIIMVGDRTNEPCEFIYQFGRGFVVVSGQPSGHVWGNHWDGGSGWGRRAPFLLEWLLLLGSPKWIVAAPDEGQIEADQSFEIDLNFDATDMDPGTYHLVLLVELEGEVEPAASFSCVLTINDPVAAITGVVTDEETGDPIEGVTASLDVYIYERPTDAEGNYELANLPEGDYQITFSAPDYLPTTVDVELGEDGAEVDVALLHSEANLSQERIDFELAPETDSHVDFTVSNDGNGPLTYTVDRRLLGDANAAPWEVRQTYDFGNIVEDDRVEGVAFDGEFFYLSGADGDNPNTIYVLNRDLEIVRTFNQPGESRYGMKDLEWDGELLWGSGETRVFGFDTEGNVEHEFQSPFNPTNCIAWDSDREVLWISSTTSDMHAYTREGQATGARILRRGLRIYGLAYWPDDPDGHPLYVFNSPAGGQLVVHKIDPDNGDTLRARNLEVPEGAAAGGAFICNTFDVYSWVLMAVNSIAPNLGGDRVNILQLDARKEWFLVDPVAGVIEAGAEQVFDLHLNATGLPPVMFQGELVFLHDGVGGETHLPVNLDVVEGPVHSIRNIPLNMGWNIVSANLQPDEDNFRAIMAGLVEEDILVAVKDDGGHFYLPASDFSNLGGWVVSEGYWVKVTRAAEFSVEGMTVMSDDPIDLVQGWQAVSYYPRRAVDATVALSGVVEDLIVAKDAAGNFYLPEFGFSNMGEMDELQGYQLKMSEATELVYRTRMEGVAGLAKSTLQADPKHFGMATHTGQNMSVLLNGTWKMENGTAEYGVFTESGLLIGSSSSSSSSSTGIAVWGDDPTTEAIDGAVEGEKLIVKIWDGSSESEATTRIIKGDLTYSTDDFAVIEVIGLKAETPVSFGLTGAYPNPFNARLTAGFDLPEAGRVKVSLYDLSGREVLHAADSRFEAGRHSVALSGDALASGVYMLRLEAAGKTSQIKVALVK